MAHEVLKELLVAVGFKVDEGSYNRATKLMANVEKQLVANDKAARERDAAEKGRVAAQTMRAAEVASNLRMVGVAVAGFATVAAGAMVTLVNAIKNAIGEFDRLAYISGRTGASVNNIKAIGYAFSQTGSSAEAAVQALESFAKARRANPGVDAMLRSYGVDTKGDASEVLSNSLDAIIKRHPQYTSQQIAGLFGISADEVDHWIRYRKEIEQFQKQYKDLQRTFGVNGGDMARASTAISRALGEWSAVVEVLRDKLVSLFLPAIESVAKALSELLKHLTNEENVAAFVAYFDKPLAALKELVRWVGVLYDQFVRLFEYVRNSPIGKIIGAINPGYFREKFLDAITPGGAQAATNPEGDTTASKEKPGIFRRGLNAIKRGLGIGGGSVDKTPLGPVPSGLLDNIARAEGTYRTGYNTSLGHGRYLPGGKEQDLTGMTLNQIVQLGRYMRSQQGNPNSSALGRYQIVGSTLKEAAKALGYDMATQKFDAETQDRMAHWIARRQGLNAWEGFKTHPAERAAAAAALARKDQSAGTTVARPVIVALPPRANPHSVMSPGTFSVDDALRSQPMGSVSNSNDNSRSATMNSNVNVTVNGATDPQATASAVTRGIGTANDMSLRNVQTAIR